MALSPDQLQPASSSSPASFHSTPMKTNIRLFKHNFNVLINPAYWKLRPGCWYFDTCYGLNPFTSWKGPREWKQALWALLILTDSKMLNYERGKTSALRPKSFVLKVHSQRITHSHSVYSTESLLSCHPRSWSKYAMRFHRYPEARMSTRTAGWCAYLHWQTTVVPQHSDSS